VSMSVVGWIVLGLIAGMIAKTVLGAKAQHGILVTIVIGIAGALLGGWAATKVFGIAATGGFFDLSTWVIAIIGSVVLLLIYHAITNRGRRSSRSRTRRPSRSRRSGFFTSRR
jgi:uncharacterized membrane protein YeaQ/YmgE (transglycosylase-associated protein family)